MILGNDCEESVQSQPSSRLRHCDEDVGMRHGLAEHSMPFYPSYPVSMQRVHAPESKPEENKVYNSRENPDFTVPIPEERKKEHKGSW